MTNSGGEIVKVVCKICSTLIIAQLIFVSNFALATEVEDNQEEVATTTESVVAVEDDSVYKTENIGRIVKNDFVVSPGRAEIEIMPGQSAIYEIRISNRISDNRVFDIEFEDMAGSPDGSRAAVLLGDEVGPHSVKDFFSVPATSFTLDLGERAVVPVKITIPPDANPGGYYGAVLSSTIAEKGESNVNLGARSPVRGRVGTLFFIKVPGDVDEAGEVKEISLINKRNLWYEKGPIEMAVLMENTGSVHLNPYGEVRIFNLFGEEVGYVELDPWYILPSSLRVREFSWDREWLLGRYVVKASINRGYGDIVDEVSVAFWVLPWKVVGGTFVVIFIILFIIRAFFNTFELKRKS